MYVLFDVERCRSLFKNVGARVAGYFFFLGATCSVECFTSIRSSRGCSINMSSCVHSYISFGKEYGMRGKNAGIGMGLLGIVLPPTYLVLLCRQGGESWSGRYKVIWVTTAIFHLPILRGFDFNTFSFSRSTRGGKACLVLQQAMCQLLRRLMQRRHDAL